MALGRPSTAGAAHIFEALLARYALRVYVPLPFHCDRVSMVGASTVSRVTLPPRPAILARCEEGVLTAIGDTPSIAATIAIAAFGSRCGPAAMQSVRRPATSRKWRPVR